MVWLMYAIGRFQAVAELQRQKCRQLLLKNMPIVPFFALTVHTQQNNTLGQAVGLVTVSGDHTAFSFMHK